ncbi:hypothetical protein FRC09_014108 [Ceratobasidium sp. 395]|nr:hypothetical protein FRC09_014108 [Ceratobasidium sp. 395]
MAYHETSEAPATDTSFRVSGDDQRVAQGEIQDAGIELNTSYLNAVISRAAGTSLEVHGTTPQKEWDSEKATKLWEIEGRGEQFQTSMSDPSTYCHRSMWAPLVRSSEQYPTDSQECYYPAYWTQPVLPAPLDKLRELNDLERHFWAERWEHTIPDPKKSKQPFGCGIQKASGASQIEPATSLLYTTQPIVEDTVESALDDPKEPSIEEEIDTKPAYIDPDQNQKMPKEAENTPHPEIDTKSTDKK